MFEINRTQTTGRDQAIFRIRLIVDAIWLIIGTTLLGIIFGNVGILMGLLGVGLVDTIAKGVAQRLGDRPN